MTTGPVPVSASKENAVDTFLALIAGHKGQPAFDFTQQIPQLDPQAARAH